MDIIFATDHAGFELKEHIKQFVEKLGHTVHDCGAMSYEATDDYPTYMHEAAKKLTANPGARAVIFGGSGQGEAMVLNRYRGVRAIVCTSGSKEIAALGREHNNANVISIGARFVSPEEAEQLVQTFLETDFSGDDRHVRRIEQLEV